jgi:thiol-disulfide isomerase/thioredoxin
VDIVVKSRFVIGSVAISLLAVSGCAKPTGSVKNEPTAIGTKGPESPPPTVEVLSWDQIQKRLEQFRGKVVVLDVWSTYCDPCIREFPNLVTLQKRFGDRIRCISFDTDYAGAKREPPDSFRKPVLEFLRKHAANELVNVISSDASEDFYNKIHLGGPPAIFVYDQNGKLSRRFDNSQAPKVPELSYQRDVVPLVEKLLADRP